MGALERYQSTQTRDLLCPLPLAGEDGDEVAPTEHHPSQAEAQDEERPGGGFRDRSRALDGHGAETVGTVGGAAGHGVAEGLREAEHDVVADSREFLPTVVGEAGDRAREQRVLDRELEGLAVARKSVGKASERTRIAGDAGHEGAIVRDLEAEVRAVVVGRIEVEVEIGERKTRDTVAQEEAVDRAGVRSQEDGVGRGVVGVSRSSEVAQRRTRVIADQGLRRAIGHVIEAVEGDRRGGARKERRQSQTRETSGKKGLHL